MFSTCPLMYQPGGYTLYSNWNLVLKNSSCGITDSLASDFVLIVFSFIFSSVFETKIYVPDACMCVWQKTLIPRGIIDFTKDDKLHTNLITTIILYGRKNVAQLIYIARLGSRNILFLVYTWYIRGFYIDSQYVHSFLPRFSILGGFKTSYFRQYICFLGSIKNLKIHKLL